MTSKVIHSTVSLVEPTGLCNSGHHQQARVSPPALDAAHVGQIDFSLERELLLRHVSQAAPPQYISTKY